MDEHIHILNALDSFEDLIKAAENNKPLVIDFEKGKQLIEKARHELSLLELDSSYTRPCNDFKGYDAFIPSLDRQDNWHEVSIIPDEDISLYSTAAVNQLWPSGAPHTKYFSRSPARVDVKFKEGLEYKLIINTKHNEGYVFSQGFWFRFELSQVSDFIPEEFFVPNVMLECPDCKLKHDAITIYASDGNYNCPDCNRTFTLDDAIWYNKD
jgi:hypothetical protein